MEWLTATVQRILEQNIFAAIFLAYLGGVLTTFTPCIYPMIPVTLAITFGTEADEKDKIKKLINPFFYCLGITVTYALLGVLAAATGTFFGQWAGNPWFYFGLAVVFILLILNLLELIHLPTLQFNYRKNNSSLISLFLFGALTGVIFSPCTAPLLGIFLAYASTQNILGGAALLFFYAAGFSSMLLLFAWLSLFAKDKMPKSGQWLLFFKWLVVFVCSLAALYLIYKGWALLNHNIIF